MRILRRMGNSILGLVFVVALTGAVDKNTPNFLNPKDPKEPPSSLKSGFEVEPAPTEIKVAAYNVENLFDTTHDHEKEDWTYLPKGTPGKAEECAKVTNPGYRVSCYKTDWTEARLQIKLGQVQRAIAAQGSLPDILVTEETENANVAQMLAKKLGYQKVIISDGPDSRGIDVAAFFNEDKLQYIEHDELDVSGRIGYGTRPILRLHFKTKSTDRHLFVFVNHWPSQANAAQTRLTASEILKAAIDEGVKKFGRDQFFALAMGDFNCLDDDSPHPVDDELTHKKSWVNALVDIQTASFSAGNPMKNQMPVASYYYSSGRTWSRFDRILATQNLVDGRTMDVVLDSFRIVGADDLMKVVKGAKVPIRFNTEATSSADAGFSDHLPVVVKVRM